MDLKLGIQDLIARVVPGGFVLWAVRTIDEASKQHLLPKTERISTEEIWQNVMLSYVTGVLLYQLSDWLIDELLMKVICKFQADKREIEKMRLRGPAIYKSLATSITSQAVMLGGSGATPGPAEIYDIALNLVEDTSQKLQNLRAQWLLHRTLATACVILVPISCLYAIRLQSPSWLPFLTLTLAVIFVLGCFKWKSHFARNVLLIAASKVIGAKLDCKPQPHGAGVGEDG